MAIALCLGHRGDGRFGATNHYIEKGHKMSKDKKNTTSANVTTATVVSNLNTTAMPKPINIEAKTKQHVSLKDLHLHKFQVVESESASRNGRAGLVVTLADGINWPFRTISVDGEKDIIQVSSAWIKQHSVDKILEAFARYCDNGHLVDNGIQAAFDSSFKRPVFRHACPCGQYYQDKSYTMRDELKKYLCPLCKTPFTSFTITRM